MLRKNFFSSNTHPYAMGVACDSILTKAWLEWEPKSIYQGLVELGYDMVDEVNAGKLGAYRTSVKTVLPWTDWFSFEHVINAFNSEIVTFDKHQPCKVKYLMAGVDTLRLCQQIQFGDEVKRYIASCAKNAELLFLPDPLTFCMKYLCRPKYKCNDCGNTDYDDLSDGRCDLCVGRYEDGILKDQPQKGLEDRGLNITRFEEYDYFPVANKFDALKQLSSDKITLGLNQLDVQIAKLLDMHYYRKEMRDRLQENLQEVKHAGINII